MARTSSSTALVLLATGCSAGFQATAQRSRTQLSGVRGLGEMRAQPIAAGAGCPTGALAVSSGKGHRPELLVAVGLPAGDGTPLAATRPTNDAMGLVATDRFGGDDSHVTRLGDGELYASWIFSTSAALDSQPAWWDVVAGSGSKYAAGSRRAFLQLVSADCGASWTRRPDIDSALIEDGHWAWPTGTPKDRTIPHAGGWDRQEVYADPFDQRLYITTRALAGSLVQYQADHGDDGYRLYYSNDGGLHVTASPMRLPPWEPLMMTSTPSGRLFMAHCVGTADGSRVRVYWVDPADLDHAQPTGTTDLGHGSGHFDECRTLASTKLPAGLTGETLPMVSLSRIGSSNGADTVRIAYPRVENGRQVRYVIGLTIAADGSAVEAPLRVIRAADPKGSVLFASFIEADGAEARATNVAVLYWLETVGSDRVVARYAAVRNGWEWTAPADLSVDAGARFTWIPTGWIGHYIRGGFYGDVHGYHYVALWPENGVPTVNVVTVSDELAAHLTEPHPHWTKATPTRRVTLPPTGTPPDQDEGGLDAPAGEPPAGD